MGPVDPRTFCGGQRPHGEDPPQARTRERLPVLPTLVRNVNEHRKAVDALLQAARQTQPGEPFTAAGQTLIRSATRHGALAGKVWADDPGTGKRRDLELEEDHAFWAWAIVEVLRATGVRVEELLELSQPPSSRRSHSPTTPPRISQTCGSAWCATTPQRGIIGGGSDFPDLAARKRTALR